MLSFCTLFDSNYLDKGIALIRSLERVARDYEIYIYAFDQKTYDVLGKMDLYHVDLVLFEDIITDGLKDIREKRTRAEFCWTCTPFIIEYTMERYKVEMCTYIDADLYFYADPNILIDEMFNAQCSVQIVEHRFPRTKTYKAIEQGSGRFCVEFNTFVNDEKGRKVLRWWREQCFDCCSSDWNTGSFGDQKYLDVWQEKFGGVNILQDHGGGVAPWNIGRYVMEEIEADGHISFRERETGERYRLVFFHFHDLHVISEDKVDINIHLRHKKIDKRLVQAIYPVYIKDLMEIRKELARDFDHFFKDPWRKDTCIFWKKEEKLSLTAKLKRIVRCPLAAYRKCILEKKDIICVG